MRVGDPFNPYGIFVGSFIPNDLMRYPLLSANAKLAYARLAQFKGKNGKAVPSRQRLAFEIGASLATAKRAVEELIGHELIRKKTPTDGEKGTWKTCEYEFLWHPLFEYGTDAGWEKKEQLHPSGEHPPSAQIDTPRGQIEPSPLGSKLAPPRGQIEPQRESVLRESKTSTTRGQVPKGQDKPKRPLNDLQQVMCGFKVAMGIDLNDREWDDAFFGKYSKQAKALLALFGGDVGKSLDCIEGVGKYLDSKGFKGWGPRAIENNATHWKAGTLGK